MTSHRSTRGLARRAGLGAATDRIAQRRQKVTRNRCRFPDGNVVVHPPRRVMVQTCRLDVPVNRGWVLGGIAAAGIALLGFGFGSTESNVDTEEIGAGCFPRWSPGGAWIAHEGASRPLGSVWDRLRDLPLASTWKCRPLAHPWPERSGGHALARASGVASQGRLPRVHGGVRRLRTQGEWHDRSARRRALPQHLDHGDGRQRALAADRV